jgi:Protein of unknown function (DUF4235)
MPKTLYRAASLLATLVGGMAAKAIFAKTWKLAAHEDEAPKATDAHRGWREILLAAVLHGALLAAVQAVLNRAVAEGTHKLTGTWLGDGPEERQ